MVKLFKSHQVIIAICEWMLIEHMVVIGMRVHETHKNLSKIFSKRLSDDYAWLYDICYRKVLDPAVQTFDTENQYSMPAEMASIVTAINKNNDDGTWQVLSDDPWKILFDINPQADDADQMKQLRDLKDGRRSAKAMWIFACDQCKKVFPRKDHLVRHIRLFHSQRRFGCKFCAKTFSSPENRERHIKSIHQTQEYVDCPHPHNCGGE